MLWRLLSFLPAFRILHKAVIELAVAAGVHLKPKTLHTMRLDQSAMLAVITAATKAVIRAKQATTAALAVLEENKQLKLQHEQAETADAQLDEALTELKAAVDQLTPDEDAADPQPPVPPVEGDPSGSPVVVDAGGGSGSDPAATEGNDPSGSTDDGSPESGSGSSGEKGPQGAEGTPSGN